MNPMDFVRLRTRQYSEPQAPTSQPRPASPPPTWYVEEYIGCRWKEQWVTTESSEAFSLANQFARAKALTGKGQVRVRCSQGQDCTYF